MKEMQNDILSYREMCEAESSQTMQRGMNFRMNPNYSVILMSQRQNAPYNDSIDETRATIEYEGHNALKRPYDHDPKTEDQPKILPSGR